MMMAASKSCAYGVRFRSAAPAARSDTLYGWISDDTGLDMGNESTPFIEFYRCE